MYLGVKEKLLRLIEDKKEDIINFLIQTIRTPSESSQEEKVAKLYAKKMEELGFDEVGIDGIGNVIGKIKATECLHEKCLLINGHMDHVPPGKMADPYEGLIVDATKYGKQGKAIYGRGASDMKGALAAIIFAGAALKELNVNLKRDLIITPVVLEEGHGSGTKYLMDNSGIKAEYAIIGEATNLGIALGHRGLMQHVITTKGKSAHASKPDQGINAFYKMVDIVSALRRNVIPNLPEDDLFGKTNMSINTCEVSPGFFNVTPDSCNVIVDTRNIPSLTADAITKLLSAEIEKLKAVDPELDYEIKPNIFELHAYTGLKVKSESIFYHSILRPMSQLLASYRK